MRSTPGKDDDYLTMRVHGSSKKECRLSSVDSDLEAFSPNRKKTADGSAAAAPRRAAARPWVRLGGSSRTERNDCLDGRLYKYADQ